MDEIGSGCLKLIFSLIITIIMFVMICNINKRTKLIEQRTRYLIEKDTLIIKEINNKEYYYR
jgi:competence protein ComGC